MTGIILDFLNLIIFAGLLFLGFITGTLIEKSHYRSIKKREEEFLYLPVSCMKNIEFPSDTISGAKLVGGNAVIAIDYFKRFAAMLRNILGGRVISYESLLDRARREAVLRMKQRAWDADIIVCMRIETASILSGKKRKATCVEAFAYGTAIKLKSRSSKTA